jgi:hypothetical protein
MHVVASRPAALRFSNFVAHSCAQLQMKGGELPSPTIVQIEDRYLTDLVEECQ